MHQQQHRDLRRDFRGIALEAAQVELLADFLHDHPRRGRFPAGHVEAAIERQRRHQADHRPLRLGQGLHQAADVVFEELLLIEREEGYDLDSVQGVAAGQAEVQVVAALLQGNSLQAELGGLVLVLGERLGIDHLQANPAVRLALVGTQQFFDAPGVVAQRHQFPGTAIRIEEVQVDRLVEAGQDPLGSGTDGVELLLGQVEPHAAEQQAGDHVEGQERQRDQQQPGARGQHAFHRHPLIRLSSGRPPPPWRPARRRSG